MNRCHICKRLIDSETDPLSRDCGGDCIYCMIREEVSIGAYEAAANLAYTLAEDIRTYMRIHEED